jgi:hypothetical protein
VITWTNPFENGSPLTKYTIQIKDSVGNFITELNDCDGSDSIVLGMASCIIPLNTLTMAPFNLQLADAIVAKITAHNIYGASIVSETGSGANIVFVPDAPINFNNVPAITLASRIGLSW